MSIIAGPIALTRFKVEGDINKDLVLFGLEANVFHTETPIPMERVTGFTDFFNISKCAFTAESVQIDNFLVFAVRTDTRKVSGELVKIELAAKEEQYLADNKQFSRVPKSTLKAMKEEIRDRLIEQTPPAPTLCHIVINTETGDMVIDTRAQRTVETVSDMMRKAFGSVGIRMMAPIGQSGRV